MPNNLVINELRRVALVGVGLLGGSIGLALRAAGFTGVRVGVGRRAESLQKAIECEAIDEAVLDAAEGVRHADLVVLCTPIRHFAGLLESVAAALPAGCLVTDVGSTKTEVVRWAEQRLPKTVDFVGSHPMAGSEKTGVEYARADLFDGALCLLTPTRRTRPAAVRRAGAFWEALGGITRVLPPRRHDALLARVSHLPHAAAAAMVAIALEGQAIDLAGPGFGDATRIAGGDPDLWTDIFRTNRAPVIAGVDKLIAELTRFRKMLADDDEARIRRWLARSQAARDAWIQRRYRQRGK